MIQMASGIKKAEGTDNVTREFFNGNWSAINSYIENVTDIFKLMFNNGILNSEAFSLTYNGNLSVTMAEGKAIYNGRILAWPTDTLTFDPVTDGNNDIVTVYLTWNEELGTSALMSSRSNFEDTDVNGIKLYVITLAPGMTAITAANVSDKRQVTTFKL